jgi:hypothetical protein
MEACNVNALFRLSLLLVAACHGTAGAGADSTAMRPGSTQGGPAPATVLPAEQLKALKSILSRYQADHLDVKQARALLAAVRKAGLQDGPALHKAMGELGFGFKRVAALANETQGTNKPHSDTVVTPSGRVVPPRQ